MKSHDDLSYVQPLRLNKEWTMSQSLVSHNCRGVKGVDLTWGHTSRFNTPLACYGCGEIVPKEVEEIFRNVLLLAGRTPNVLVPPFSNYPGMPGAKEKYEKNKETL